MTRLVWNVVGERFFEAGIDHGVLYVDGAGVAWNGLLSVAESSSGGDTEAYYIDGVKYMQRSNLEEFEATIEAYTYPDEFLPCDGVKPINNGLFAAQQRKKAFSLCYRTALGNDVDGAAHAFKLHLVYEALASPSERDNRSMSDSIEPFNFSWKIVTKPPTITGIRQTSKFVIDSRDVPSDLMQQILDILYGSDTTPPRIPSVTELIFIFDQYETTSFDAGHVGEEYFVSFDAGHVGDPYTSSIDGGTL